MAEPIDDNRKVENARKKALQFTLTILLVLVVQVAVIYMRRGESDQTYWKGVLSLFLSIGLPAAMFLQAHDTLVSVKRRGRPLINELAPTYLRVYKLLCMGIVLAVAWYGFFAKATEATPIGNGQMQEQEIPYPFGDAMDAIGMIAAPLFAFILSRQVFAATSALTKDG